MDKHGATLSAADEYDALIDDPTDFLYNVWLPRVSTEVSRLVVYSAGGVQAP